MATIDRLKICGIRSFSPEDSGSVIQFYKPMTVIVGSNGSGKTTIIECLAYACTGTFPPSLRNSKDMFINDPRLTGSTSVKAQIKMKLYSLSKSEVVVTRTMEAKVSTKKSKTTFTTLDSTIQTVDMQGKRSSIAKRKDDLDKEIPELLGVSAAVLEHVIFVHQEDSNWPLSDSKSVKERFDQIFAATRYTKALDAIAKFARSMAADLRVERVRLEGLASNKDQAARVLQSIEVLELKIENSEDQRKTLEAELAKADESRKQLQGLMDQALETRRAIEALEVDKRNKEEQRNSLFGRIPSRLDMTPAELGKQLDDIDNKVRLTGDDIAQLDRKRDDLTRQLQALEGRLENDQTSLVQLMSEREAVNVAKRDRSRLIRSLMTRYGLPASTDDEGELADDDVAAFLDNLQGAHKTATGKVRECQTANDEREAAISKQLDAARSKANQAVEALKFNEKQISEKRKRGEQLAGEIAKLSTLPQRLEYLEIDVARKEKETADEREKLEAMNVDAQVDDLKKRAAEATGNSQKLKEELRDMTDQLEKQATVKHLASELETRQAKMSVLAKQHAPAAAAVLELDSQDAVPAGADAVAKLRERLAEVQTGVDGDEERLRRTEHELASVRGSAARGRQDLEKLRTALAAQQQELDAKLGDLSAEDVGERLAEATTVRDSLRNAHAMFKSSREFLTFFAQQAREDKCCPFCTQSLEAEEIMAAAVDNMVSLQSKASDEAVADSVAKLKDAEAKVERLSALPAMRDEVQKVQSDVTAAEEEDKRLSGRVDELTGEAETLRERVKQGKQKMGKLRELVDAMGKVAAMGEECKAMERTLESHRLALGGDAAGAGGARTLDDVRADIEAADAAVEAAHKETERIRRRREQAMTQIGSLERQARELRSDADGVRRQLEGNDALKREQDDVAAAMERMEKELPALREQRQQSEKETEDLGQRLRKATVDGRSALSQVNQALTAVERDREKVESFTTTIHRYRDSGKETALAQAEERMGTLRETMRNVRADVEATDKRKADKKEKLGQARELRQNVIDNVELHKLAAEIAALDERIRELSRDVAPKEKVEQAETRLAALREDVRAHTEDIAGLQGKIRAHREEIRSRREELKQDVFKDIETRHADQQIKVVTMEMASTDLQRYKGALDKSLLDFHQQKMEDINRIIRELWSNTYRGNDIDYIKIVTQVPERETARRSYNYCVVMVKGSTEMDMRGRCSAGQKVLASLIIRLALAETFCLNCGILALDEPTTNLDEPNIHSFAESLLRIVKMRERQKNYQLIVITHDEQFVQLLGRGETAEYFYRVSKNPNGFSQIERADMRLL